MAEEVKTVIKPQKNGPLLVRDLERLLDAVGVLIPTKKFISLCRCGSSKTKPFCDGTHAQIHFNSARISTLNNDQRISYQGKKITINDNRAVCSSAGYCVRGLPGVWRRGEEPWIDPDAAEPEQIIEIIRRCPSGALSFSIDGVEDQGPDREPEIQIRHNGPFDVRGGIELEGENFCEGASREHYQLCRCGASKSKPFCDGTHWHNGFDDGQETGSAVVSDIGGLGDNPPGKREGVNIRRRRHWHKAAVPGELEDGQVKAVSAAGRVIALIRVRGRYGALDGVCPHQGGPLAEGTIEGGVLRCPWHGWGFDPFTGQDTEGRHAAVATYPVELREDGTYIQVEEISGVSTAPTTGRTISDVIIETMVNWGVTHVFGMVGATNLGIADAIRRAESDGKMNFIGIRHEGAAAFAASGYAKLSGRPAACLTIAGPGATNLLTGLWDAKSDRTPLLAITGQVKMQYLGPGAFQEIDLPAAFEAVAAFSQTVMPGSNHAELVSLALKHATIERGVGHLVIPDEVQTQPAQPEERALHAWGRVEPELIAPPAESLQEAVNRIAAAESPVIIAGYGARLAMEPILALAARLKAPIINTFRAMGQVPYEHPLYAGVLGMSGTPVASGAMASADLLIVFGCSFSDHTGIDTTRPIIQVDCDRMSLGKSHPVAQPVWGDAYVTAGLILGSLPKKLAAIDQRQDLGERRQKWQKECDRREMVFAGKGVNPVSIMRTLSRQAANDAVIAVDVGANTVSFGHYFECKEQAIIMSGYLGSIGFAFPAAMGAWAAEPRRQVIAVAGDGGFAQYMAEFTTAVKYGMSITLILLNNSELGMISREQREAGLPVWQTSLINPDFSEYAKSCGGFGVRVEKVGDLDAAIRAALADPGPAIVDIMTDSESI